MNVNINNFVISQAPDNIIRSNYSNTMNKGMFANMLNNAMTENQNMVILGDDFNNLLVNTGSLPEGCVEDFEDNDEIQNHISYENIINLADIFFFRPNVVKIDMAENTVKNVDYDFFENQLHHPKGIGQANSLIPQEKQGIESLISQVKARKLISEIEANIEEPKIESQNEKPKNEYEHEDLFTIYSTLIKNKIITISDESTEIKSQVLSQVKDKIIIMTERGQELDGIKTITMELQPQNLGKVDIKLIYENNKLTVEIKALNEETQKILLSNTGELKNMLSKSSEADVNIIVKPYEFELKHQSVNNYQNTNQGNEQNFYQNNDQNHQGRQRNKYYYDNNIKQNEEDVFSEFIDLSNLKIKEGGYGS